MQIDLGKELEDFRSEIRSWLEQNAVEELRGDRARQLPDEERRQAQKEWERRLQEAGLICAAWPEEYGGRRLDGLQNQIVSEEFSRAGMSRVARGMGESLVGPSIIVHGTEEQKRHFLPRILDGTDRYCQGFSEPGAGSDLAGLQTRGVVDGEEVVITGQKVWTSGAQRANMMFCLCRTNWEVPKHQGISYVLVPMRTEDGETNGFDVRPLRQMTGGAGFSEVFIDGARAPLFNVIGGLNNGWRVSMTTLGNERSGGSNRHVGFQARFHDLVEVAKEKGKVDDPTVRQDLAWAWTHVEIMRFQSLKQLAAALNRQDPGPISSTSKMFWSEFDQRFGEIAMNIIGPEAMLRPDGEGYRLNRWQQGFLSSRSHTIWGGTAQVQRNIVGERVLGLPKEPGNEREVPFKDLPKG